MLLLLLLLLLLLAAMGSLLLRCLPVAADVLLGERFTLLLLLLLGCIRRYAIACGPKRRERGDSSPAAAARGLPEYQRCSRIDPAVSPAAAIVAAAAAATAAAAAVAADAAASVSIPNTSSSSSSSSSSSCSCFWCFNDRPHGQLMDVSLCLSLFGYRHLALTHRLLAVAVDILNNKKFSFGGCVDAEGNTPLHIAAEEASSCCCCCGCCCCCDPMELVRDATAYFM